MSSSVDDWASFALCTRDSNGAANLACLTATDGVPDADDSTGWADDGVAAATAEPSTAAT
jgi:hypothetical protein